jgi:uncharacterized coiled-coil protein SlyX
MEALKIVEQFAGKFDKFIYLYKRLKESNKNLEKTVEELNLKIAEKDNLIKELEYKLEISNLAETFVSSSGDTRTAKVKINNIVREIDNCIALLNR